MARMPRSAAQRAAQLKAAKASALMRKRKSNVRSGNITYLRGSIIDRKVTIPQTKNGAKRAVTYRALNRDNTKAINKTVFKMRKPL